MNSSSAARLQQFKTSARFRLQDLEGLWDNLKDDGVEGPAFKIAMACERVEEAMTILDRLIVEAEKAGSAKP